MKEFVAWFGAGTWSTQAKSRIKLMDKMLENGLEGKPVIDWGIFINFEPAWDIKGPMV